MVIIQSTDAATFQDVAAIWEQILDFEPMLITVRFLDDDLTVEFRYDENTRILSAVCHETGEIHEESDIRLEGELFRAISGIISNLYFCKGLT